MFFLTKIISFLINEIFKQMLFLFKQEIFFNFSAPFEIHDDNEIMKRMQLHCCHAQPELEQLVPPHLAPFAASWQQHWTAQEQPKPEPPPEPPLLPALPLPLQPVLPGLMPSPMLIP